MSSYQPLSHDLFNFSKREESKEGRWAHGRSMDGKGEFRYISVPVVFGSAPKLKLAPKELFNIPKKGE
ncbi:hypothetical protein OAS1_29280 [Bacillus sp. YKCMOAS1]|nr:hypothetical protein OAS1_29280 [Bacillus sp. YKCMOAS1]